MHCVPPMRRTPQALGQVRRHGIGQRPGPVGSGMSKVGIATAVVAVHLGLDPYPFQTACEVCEVGVAEGGAVRSGCRRARQVDHHLAEQAVGMKGVQGRVRSRCCGLKRLPRRGGVRRKTRFQLKPSGAVVGSGWRAPPDVR